MKSLPILVTEDFTSLQEFFHRNGLEIDLTQREPTGVLRMWEAQSEDGTRRGAVKLERRAGELVLAGIAVEEPYRRERLGTALLETALSYCRTLDDKRLLLLARAPDFFKRAGFRPLNMEDYRSISKCYDCPQRGKSCFPELLYLDL